MNKTLYTLAALLFSTAASAADITVKVEYNGNSAVVTIPSEASSWVTCESGTSAHVKLVQSSTTLTNPGEIIYSLSGQSDAGEFYLTGEYKATIQLNGLTLTNPDSTAIHIKNGKRIKVSMAANTVNTLADGTKDESSKGCFHCKGHTEFVGKGTLNISSNIIGIIVSAHAPSMPAPSIAAHMATVCNVPVSVVTSKYGSVRAAPSISIILSSRPSLAWSLTNLFFLLNSRGMKNSKYASHAIFLPSRISSLSSLIFSVPGLASLGGLIAGPSFSVSI